MACAKLALVYLYVWISITGQCEGGSRFSMPNIGMRSCWNGGGSSLSLWQVFKLKNTVLSFIANTNHAYQKRKPSFAINMFEREFIKFDIPIKSFSSYWCAPYLLSHSQKCSVSCIVSRQPSWKRVGYRTGWIAHAVQGFLWIAILNYQISNTCTTVWDGHFINMHYYPDNKYFSQFLLVDNATFFFPRLLTTQHMVYHTQWLLEYCFEIFVAGGFCPTITFTMECYNLQHMM